MSERIHQETFNKTIVNNKQWIITSISKKKMLCFPMATIDTLLLQKEMVAPPLRRVAVGYGYKEC
jgi:hypothetical protein